MDFGIKGKRALITGAGRGIGESIGINLAKEGVKVAVVSRTESDLKKLVNKMGGEGRGHRQIAMDLIKLDSPKRVMRILNENFGGIDILINNLGSTLEIKDPFCSLEDWKTLYRMNLEVAVEFSNLVLPYMKKRKWGRIINISSTAGMENNGPVPYCAMKAALTAYTRSMGRALAKTGVVMSAVMAGAILTKGGYWEKALKEKPEHAAEYLKYRCPLGKFGEPDDIGTMVAVLASEQAKFCQGSIFPVDGGQSRHFFWTRDW